jgi:dethiobiotin synthetase
VAWRDISAWGGPKWGARRPPRLFRQLHEVDPKRFLLMSVLVVTGTGTGVGKTVVTAAVAALAAARGSRVAVVKAAQTGVGPDGPGDLDDVRRLAAVTDLHEFARLRDPLSPAAAARRAGLPSLDLRDAGARVRALAHDRDLVVVEGAGGLLVRYDDAGATIADLAVDLARDLDAAVLVVVDASLGTLNHTALTLEALAHRGLMLAGVVVGAWPDEPDLACRSNIRDLETLAAQPLAGAMRARAGALEAAEFLLAARAGLGPSLGGAFDAADFRRAHD